MSDFETFTSYRVNVVAVQLVCRRKADRVDETVKLRPHFCQLGEQRFDALIFRDIARQDDIRAQRGGKFFHTTFQFFVLIGERQFSPFTVHGLRDAVGDGQFAGKASQQNALTGKKTHSF